MTSDEIYKLADRFDLSGSCPGLWYWKTKLCMDAAIFLEEHGAKDDDSAVVELKAMAAEPYRDHLPPEGVVEETPPAENPSEKTYKMVEAAVCAEADRLDGIFNELSDVMSWLSLTSLHAVSDDILERMYSGKAIRKICRDTLSRCSDNPVHCAGPFENEAMGELYEGNEDRLPQLSPTSMLALYACVTIRLDALERWREMRSDFFSADDD